MDQTLFALPILPGKTEAARAFLTELEGERKGQFATSQGRLALTKLIRELAGQGRTVVFSSHLLAQAEEICDRIAILGNGRLLAEGTPVELLGPDWRPVSQSSSLEKLYLEKLRG